MTENEPTSGDGQTVHIAIPVDPPRLIGSTTHGRLPADHQGFLEAVEAGPRDVRPKSAYSDWLRDHDFPTQADVWKWLAMTGRHPAALNDRAYIWGGPEHQYLLGPQSCLPGPLWNKISWDSIWYYIGASHGRTSSSYRSIHEAVGTLVRVWGTIRTGRLIRRAWVADPTPVQWLSPDECAFLRASGGVR